MSDEQNQPQAPAPEQAPTPPAGGGGEKPYDKDDGIMLFLAYFGLLSLIPFLMFKDKRSDPKKEYVYWHGRQGVIWCIALVALSIAFTILSFVPFLGCLLWPAYMLIWLGGSIMCWMKAFAGQKWVIPGIGAFADKLG